MISTIRKQDQSYLSFFFILMGSVGLFCFFIRNSMPAYTPLFDSFSLILLVGCLIHFLRD